MTEKLTVVAGPGWAWRLARCLEWLSSGLAQARTAGPDHETEYEVVYRAAGELEAHVVKGRLESEGLPVLLRYESVGPVFGLSVGGLGQVEILVPAPLGERAREILAEDEGD
jgi:hypothetical protein